MDKNITFSPHVWGSDKQRPDASEYTEVFAQAVENKEENVEHSIGVLDEILDDGDSSGAETLDIDDLFERAEASASEIIEPDETLINESQEDSESLSSDDGDAAAFARGVMAGEEKQKAEQDEDLANAEIRIKEILTVVEEQKIKLTRDMDRAIFSFLESTAHIIFDDLISDNASKLIVKKAKQFIEEHSLYDFKLTLELSESDFKLWKELGEVDGDLVVVANSLLKDGKASLTASPKDGANGALRAEMDVKDLVNATIKEVSGA